MGSFRAIKKKKPYKGAHVFLDNILPRLLGSLILSWVLHEYLCLHLLAYWYLWVIFLLLYYRSISREVKILAHADCAIELWLRLWSVLRFGMCNMVWFSRFLLELHHPWHHFLLSNSGTHRLRWHLGLHLAIMERWAVGSCYIPVQFPSVRGSFFQ